MGAKIPSLRKKELAEDNVHAVHVVLDILEKHKFNDSDGASVMMLLPTSPLRTKEHIIEAIDLFDERNYPSLVSVTNTNFYEINIRSINNNDGLEPLTPLENPNQQRQSQKKLFGVNGAIFLAKISELLSSKTFHMNKTLAYKMSYLHSVDINSEEDIIKANNYYKILNNIR